MNEKESENIALLDLDGTVADYDTAMRNSMAPYTSSNDPPYEPHNRETTPSHQRRLSKLLRSQPGWWRSIPEIPLGMQIVDLLVEMGFYINVLTKGPTSTENAWTEKIQWCRDHLSPRLGKLGKDYGATITLDKGIVYGKVLVDDYPEYVERWLEWRPRGLVLMVPQVWNEGFSHPNVIRCDKTFKELNLVERLAETIAR